MKIIIPYRENSQRCIEKNTREFLEGKSLLQITLEQLYNHDVSLACIPTPTALERANSLGVKNIDLSSTTATGGWSELAIDIANQLEPNNEPVGFVFCTNPVFYIFNQIQDFLTEATNQMHRGAGSAMVVYPFKHYVLDERMQGVNHGQGWWHKYSQHLPQWYINPWFMTVTTVPNILKYNYWHTPDVFPLLAAGPCVDIDTQEDFELSKVLYKIKEKC